MMKPVFQCASVFLIAGVVWSAEPPPVIESAASGTDKDRVLPFACTVRAREGWINGFRTIDAPIKHTVVDGEVWLLDGIQGKYWSHKGPDLEHLNPHICHKEVPVTLGNGENIMICGAWFDSGTRRLYAVIHSERYHHIKRDMPRGSPSPGWCRKKTALAISDDMGKTWQNGGDILSSPYEGEAYDWLRFSGNEFEAGPADFDFYVDERGGYFYLTCWNSYVPKNGGLNGFHMFSEVARCAISDRMAPGKWHKFCDGKWTEPGLGGKASRVRFDRRGLYGGTIYSTYLKKYVRIGVHAGIKDDRGWPGIGYNDRSIYISTCTDLGKQDWSPMAKLLDDPSRKPGLFGFTLADGQGISPMTCDNRLRVYNYWERSMRILDVTLTEGTTPAAYFPPGDSYAYQPHPESGDPIESRSTRIIGCASAEARYTGAWGEAKHPHYYSGMAKVSSNEGSQVEWTFPGADIYWRAEAAPDGGLADVFVDGKFERTVDLYFGDCELPYQFAFIKRGLDTNGVHTIRVAVRGARNPDSRGTMVRHIAFEEAADSRRFSWTYSAVQGKNGWRYQKRGADGKTADLDFRFIEGDRFKGRWGDDAGPSIASGELIPAPDQEAVLTWTAPRAGTVRIEGDITVANGCCFWDPVITYVGQGEAATQPTSPKANKPAMVVGIVKDGSDLLSLVFGQDRATVNHDVYTEVKAGELMGFRVARPPRKE
jgi:hypothetical protein